MKYYDFLEKRPPIPRVTIVEGVERLFAERALAIVVDRLLPPAERDFNLERIDATSVTSFAAVAASVAAMPFLGTSRVVVVRGAHDLKAAPRRELLAVMLAVPEQSYLLVEDLVAPASKRPEPLGKLAGRGPLRIDTTPSNEARARFIRESFAELGAAAADDAIEELVRSDGDLGAIRTDIDKLALLGHRVSADDVARETLISSDVRAYRFAAAAVAGRTVEATAMARELFAADPRGAAIPMLSALASEYKTVWELARGEVPASLRWRERELRPIARRLGERRARLGYERAVRGFEAIVTGRADDPALVVDLAIALA